MQVCVFTAIIKQSKYINISDEILPLQMRRALSGGNKDKIIAELNHTKTHRDVFEERENL